MDSAILSQYKALRSCRKASTVRYWSGKKLKLSLLQVYRKLPLAIANERSGSPRATNSRTGLKGKHRRCGCLVFVNICLGFSTNLPHLPKVYADPRNFRPSNLAFQLVQSKIACLMLPKPPESHEFGPQILPANFGGINICTLRCVRNTPQALCDLSCFLLTSCLYSKRPPRLITSQHSCSNNRTGTGEDVHRS